MQENNQYRLYTFTNFYLSSIQKGIQTTHVTSELSHLFIGKPHHEVYLEWAKSGITTVVLNGGNQRSILDGFETVKAFGEAFKFPYAIFREDEDSLGGAVTASGIILPPEIWKDATDLRNRVTTINDVVKKYDNSHNFDGQLVLYFFEYLNSCPLAS